MRRRLSKDSILFSAVLLSFAWNIFLLVGVVLNFSFVHTRAAGGQFTNFPASIRIVYLLQLVLVIYQAWIFKRIFHGEPIKFVWLPNLFLIVGIIGILLNALSISSNERWNAIPAAIITWAFWHYGIKKVRQGS